MDADRQVQPMGDNDSPALGDSSSSDNDPEELDDVVFEDDAENADPKALVKKLRARIMTLTKEKQEYLDGWQRLKADYLNLNKRSLEDRKDAALKAKLDLIADLGPVLESFSGAFGNKEAWERVDKNWRIGVEYIYTQLIEALKNNGLEEVVPKVGDSFDPTLHHAVETLPAPNPKDDHTIALVLQSGYRLEGTIVRPPRVKVYVQEGQGV